MFLFFTWGLRYNFDGVGGGVCVRVCVCVRERESERERERERELELEEFRPNEQGFVPVEVR